MKLKLRFMKKLFRPATFSKLILNFFFERSPRVIADSFLTKKRLNSLSTFHIEKSYSDYVDIALCNNVLSQDKNPFNKTVIIYNTYSPKKRSVARYKQTLKRSSKSLFPYSSKASCRERPQRPQRPLSLKMQQRDQGYLRFDRTCLSFN